MPESDLRSLMSQPAERAARQASNLVITVPHASAALPHYLDQHGVSAFWQAAAGTHFASDRGAAALARNIAAILKTGDVFEGSFSRLVVDLNRPIEDPSALPAIAGEHGTSPLYPPRDRGDLAARRTHHQAFHSDVETAILRRGAAGDVILIDQHSFDRYGEPGLYRSVDIGVCAPANAEYALALYDALLKRCTPRLDEVAPHPETRRLNVRLNEPYSADHPGAYIARRHASPKVACAVIEVCDDLLANQPNIQSIARLIAAAAAEAAIAAPRSFEESTHNA